MNDSEEVQKKEWSEPKLFSLSYKYTYGGSSPSNKEDAWDFDPLSGTPA